MKKMGIYRFIFYSALTLGLLLLGHLWQHEASAAFWADWSLWREALLAGLGCGLIAGILGVYILLNRIVFVTLALAQGAGLGIFLVFWVCGWIGYHINHDTLPLLVGMGTAALFAISFAWLRRFKTYSEESLIGLLYVISSGMILIVGDRIAQGQHDMENLLFGNAVAVSLQDLRWIAVVTGLIVLAHGLFHRRFLYASADPVFMRSKGMRVRLWMGILFGLIAVGITVSLKTLGALPVFGLMVVPAFIALKNARSLTEAFAVALLIGVALPVIGFFYSYLFDFPTGASLIFVSLFYLAGAWVEGPLLRIRDLRSRGGT
jgi:zinc transport system permease protein